MARRKQHSRRSDCDGDYVAVAREVMGTTWLWLEESNIADNLI